MEIKDLSTKLTEYRKGAGLTQEQVSAAIGVKRSTYAYYETGNTKPKLNTLIKLARLYNVSVDMIIDDPELRSGDTSYSDNEDIKIDDSFNNLSDYEKVLVLKYRLMSQAEKKRLSDFLNSIK